MNYDSNNPFADLPDATDDMFADLPPAKKSGLLPALSSGIDKVQELGYRAIKGFTDVGENPSNLEDGSAAKWIAESIGQGGSLSKFADKGIARNLEQQQAYQPTVPSYKDVDSIGNAASYVGELTAGSLPYMAAALYPPSMLALGGGLSNEAYEAQEEKSPGRAVASGFGQMALERVGALGSLGKIKQVAGGPASGVAKSMLSEGATEAGQDALAQWGTGKSLDQIDTDSLTESFVGGAAVGGTIRTGTEAYNAAQNKLKPKPALSETETTDLFGDTETTTQQTAGDVTTDYDPTIQPSALSTVDGEVSQDWQPDWQFGQNDMPYRGQMTPYTYEGEILDPFGDIPNSVPVGQVLNAPIIEGDFERPRALPDRSNVIYGTDGRPLQQAQEFADNINRNYQPGIEQKDIIFAGDNRELNYQTDGKPFGGKKAAAISKGFRQAQKDGLNPQVVQVNGGYAWKAQNDRVDTASIEGQRIDESGSTGIAQPGDQQPDLSRIMPGNNIPATAQRNGQSGIENLPVANGRVRNDDAIAKTPIKEIAKDLAGEKINKEWVAFADDTGTKKVPRSEMPQIKAEHRGAMVNFMNGRDITHTQEEVESSSLKPTQTEFSPAKVKKAMGYDGGDRSIIVSSDNYVLDGHHQWLAKRQSNEPVKVIRLNAPIDQLIPLAKEFPSSELATDEVSPVSVTASTDKEVEAKLATKQAEKIDTKKEQLVEKSTNAEPAILSQTKSKWLNQELAKAKINKNSPGYETARAKIEARYDDELDKAYAELPFERYNELNNDTPEGINRSAYEALTGKKVEAKAKKQSAEKVEIPVDNNQDNGMKPTEFNINKTIFKTGSPAKLFYAKNKESAPKLIGMDMGQDIEPGGDYLVVDQSDMQENQNNNWDYGLIEFKNPLVLEHKATNSTGWKKDLSEMFGGKTGKGLSTAVKKAGYDGVLTIDQDRKGNFSLSEAVNLSGVKTSSQKKADTDGNIMFNRTTPVTGSGVTEKTAKLAFKQFVQKFKGLNNAGFDQIITNKKPSEIFGPSVAADDNYIKGAYYKDTNRLYVFTQNHTSIDDVRRTLREELLTHKGLGIFEPQEITGLLDRINATRNSTDPEIQKIWKDIDKNYANAPELVQAEEFLGKVSQQEVSVPAMYWNRIVAYINKLLRKLNLVKDGITMAEMKSVVSQISAKLQAGSEARNYAYNAQGFADSGLMYNRASPDNNSSTLQSAKAKLGLSDEDPANIVGKIKQTIAGFNFKESKDRAKEGIFDSLYGIKKAEEAAGVEQENQGYISARLAAGVGDVVHAVMFHGSPEWREGIVQRKADSKGLLEVIGQLDEKQLNDWLAWMGANRAAKLMKEGRENNLTQTEIDALLALNKGNEKLFNKVKNEYNAINAATLDLAQQAGLVAPEIREKFDSEWYVPFFRQEETDDMSEVISGGFSPSGIANQSGNLRKLKGGKMATNDILENILKRQATLIEAAMKNKAMAEVANNLAGTTYMESVKLNKIEAEQVGRLRASGKATPYVSVMRNGEKTWYKVSDPALLRGLVQLNVKRTDHPLMKISRAAKRFLTTGVTLSPEFIIRNYIRDSVHGWMINKDGFMLGIDSVKGAVKTWKKDESTLDLMFAGASFQGGYVHANDPEGAAQQIRRALRKKGLNEGDISKYLASIPSNMGKLLEKYRGFSDAMENANRASTYSAAIAAKKTKKVAAFEAKDFMDFGLQGNYRTMQWLVDVIPFLNARLQGMYKLYRASKADGGDAVLKVFAKELAMKGMYVAGASLALGLINADDERYEELPDWDKDANWHFFLGDDHVRIPKPFELGILFGTIPERLLMRGLGKQNNDDLTRSAAHAIVSTMAFNPIPQIIRPGIEAFMNYDTFGMRQIDSFGDLRKRPEDRYSMYTTETAKLLGDMVGVSPKKIEHLIRGYAGTLGAYALATSDMIANSAATLTGNGEFKYNEFDDFGLVRAFYKSGEIGSSYYSEQFYNMLSEVNAVHSQYKVATEERDRETAKEILEEGKIKLKFRPFFNKAQAQMNKLSQQTNLIWKNTSIPLAQREAKVDELAKKKNALAKRVILQYRAVAD